MDLEKMKAVADVLERMVRNEERIQACEAAGGWLQKYPYEISNGGDCIEATAAEVGTILDARKKSLTEELRALGMAHLAAPASPAPSKSPVLDAAVTATKVGSDYAGAKALLNDDSDPCAARVQRA